MSGFAFIAGSPKYVKWTDAQRWRGELESEESLFPNFPLQSRAVSTHLPSVRTMMLVGFAFGLGPRDSTASKSLLRAGCMPRPKGPQSQQFQIWLGASMASELSPVRSNMRVLIARMAGVVCLNQVCFSGDEV